MQKFHLRVLKAVKNLVLTRSESGTIKVRS